MAEKLNPPALAPLADRQGNINQQWLLFFEKLAKFVRIIDVLEIGTGAIETNGNWRITQSGNNLLIQRLEAGTWTTKQTYTP